MIIATFDLALVSDIRIRVRELHAAENMTWARFEESLRMSILRRTQRG